MLAAGGSQPPILPRASSQHCLVNARIHRIKCDADYWHSTAKTWYLLACAVPLANQRADVAYAGGCGDIIVGRAHADNRTRIFVSEDVPLRVVLIDLLI